MEFIGLGLAAAGAAIGLGIIFGRFVEGSARNPEAGEKMKFWIFAMAGWTESIFFITLVLYLYSKLSQ